MRLFVVLAKWWKSGSIAGISVQGLGMTALFAISRIFISLHMVGELSDLGVHRDYVALLRAGRVPFRDFFPEYPPLVFGITAIPLLLNWPLSNFFLIFRILCFVTDCTIWFVLLGSKNKRSAAGLSYILCSSAIGAVLYDRIDIFLGLICLLLVRGVLRSKDRLCHLLVGIGIAFKLIPVIWMPLFLGASWKKNMRSFVRALLVISLPAVASFSLVALFGGYHFSSLFAYHARRGIQIESGPASIEMIAIMAGLKGRVSYEFGSLNLHTTLEGQLLALSTLFSCLTVCVFSAIALLCRVSSNCFSFMLASLLTFVLTFSKVLSPQYFAFLLPMLVILPRSKSALYTYTIDLLIIAIYALTGFIFPWNYGDLLDLKPYAIGVLAARNECVLLLAVVLARAAYVANEAEGSGETGRTPVQIPASCATFVLGKA